MEDKLETRWTEEDTLHSYNPYRELFREASARVVKDVFEKYVKPSEVIVEIGSGLGELVRLIPEYKERIQQTEQSPKVVEGNRTLNPNSNIRVANVYELPFKDGSFDIATGYSSFDTLADLGKALREVRRVLRPNGKFVHFLDIQGSANTMFHNYSNQEVVPFPLFELDATDNLMHGIGLQLIKKPYIKRLRDFFISKHQGLAGWFDAYVGNPELMFCSAYNNNNRYESVLRMASDFVKESGVGSRRVGFNEYFKNNLEGSLEQEGYEILESANRDGVAVVQRNGRHSQNLKVNIFHNDVGNDRSKYDLEVGRELEPGKVKVISTLYLAVARKK
ncbi:MAG: class I SAM-dependent methyltransferase [Nanoarchaeota archaeon]|nr:class I SAM-dependent methyltransferase [Nanoarchaeota archaeon]